jgi:hypothetical protein
MLRARLQTSDNDFPVVKESIRLIESDLTEIEAGLSRLQ